MTETPTTRTMADYLTAHEQLFDTYATWSAGFTADDLAVQSLCPDWDVRGVIAHALGVEAELRVSDSRPLVTLFRNQDGWRPDFLARALSVADITGDSLALARQAAETDAEIVVVCGVHFMAETAKILNPGRTVLIPDLEAGCSLAESITAADVSRLKARHPGVPVVTYVNPYADVKAEAEEAPAGDAKAEAADADSIELLDQQDAEPVGADREEGHEAKVQQPGHAEHNPQWPLRQYGGRRTEPDQGPPAATPPGAPGRAPGHRCGTGRRRGALVGRPRRAGDRDRRP